jgi:branched-chain amino acid transport system permease protein
MANFYATRAPIDLGPTTITIHQAITIGIAIAVAIILRLVLTRPRFGVAMRAAVDDRPLSSLNGARPDRISMLAWAIGTSLAALGGILIAPGIALDAPSLSLLIVSAYAAAIFGRLRSLPLTFLGAVVVGCAEGYLTGYLPQNQYLSGLRLAIPAIILFVVLLVLPNPRLRGRMTRSREYFPTPTIPGAFAFAVAIVFAGVVMATTLSTPDLITYGKVFSLGIVALSLVPLVGFGGQISLCQLSFAGIGGVVMAHLGTDGDPLALVWAILISAAVGALVALPALRLSGIYLALGTAAFAVFLDRWVFTLPSFEVFGLFEVSLFRNGSVAVDALDLFGQRFGDPDSQVVLTAVCFGLVSLLVIAIRRGRLGRRLLAMKDSEAACATLGLNLLRTKLTVFAISAGIAGFGGALYSMQLSSITPQNFELVTSLQIFALSVVGGIGAVGGALFGAASLLVLLPLLSTLIPSLSRWVVLFPGGAGIALGRNPNGAVKDFREGFEPLLKAPRVLAGMIVVIVASYGLRVADVIDNWTFVACIVVAVALAGLLSGLAKPVAVEEAAGESPAELADVPLEWRGIDRPWTEDDLVELDRQVGLSEAELHGVA